jgi:hypothetical protein
MDASVAPSRHARYQCRGDVVMMDELEGRAVIGRAGREAEPALRPASRSRSPDTATGLAFGPRVRNLGLAVVRVFSTLAAARPDQAGATVFR